MSVIVATHLMLLKIPYGWFIWSNIILATTHPSLYIYDFDCSKSNNNNYQVWQQQQKNIIKNNYRESQRKINAMRV